MQILVASQSYLLEQDPRRAPHWRFQRVRELLELPVERRRMHQEEAYVREATNFLDRYVSAAGSHRRKRDFRRRCLYPANPGLWHAWELCLESTPGETVEADPPLEGSMPGATDRFALRNVIEACVLARMTPYQIGNACCQLPQAIDWYERLVYDVRSRLDYSLWVHSQLIRGNVLKRYAYEGGQRALEELIRGHDATVRPPRWGKSLTSYWTGQLMARAIRRGAAEIDDAELSNRDCMHVVSAMNNQQTTDTPDERCANYEGFMQATLDNFKILTGRNGRRELNRRIGANGREPRVSDEIRAAIDPAYAAELDAELQRPLSRPDIGGTSGATVQPDQ